MVVEDVSIEVETSRGKNPVTSEVLVLSVRPRASQASRCSRCRKRCPGYDSGDGTRRWRTLDIGTTKAYLQAAVPRVQCDEHGVVVAHVPWARPGAKHTWAFEDTCAWLAANTALSVLTVFLRIAWRTVAKRAYGFQCAMRRFVVSPAQLGRTEGRFLGLMAYPMPKG